LIRISKFIRELRGFNSYIYVFDICNDVVVFLKAQDIIKIQKTAFKFITNMKIIKYYLICATIRLHKKKV